MKLYGSAACSGPPAATGTEAAFEGAGIPVVVVEDATNTIYATATDDAGNVSACGGPIVYVEDSSSPTPTLTATDPASPANANFPKLRGSGAEAGSTVTVWGNNNCGAPPLFTGTAAEFNGAGIEIEELDDDTETYSVNATDAVGNVSGCSNAITYIEDSTAPSAPTVTGTDPASGANQNSPRVKGSAEAGEVNLFTTANCGAVRLHRLGGGFGRSGHCDLGGRQLQNELRAPATDAAGNTSACSGPISYTEVTPLLEGDHTAADSIDERRRRS